MEATGMSVLDYELTGVPMVDYAPKASTTPAPVRRALVAAWINGLTEAQFQQLSNAVWEASHGKVAMAELPTVLEKWRKRHGR
jgi:hypothetical protein